MKKIIKFLGLSGALLMGSYLGLLGATIADAHIIPCNTYDPNYGYGTCDDHGNPITVYQDPGTPGGSVYINYGNSNANNTNSSVCQNTTSSSAWYVYDPATGTYTWQSGNTPANCVSGGVSAGGSYSSGSSWGNAPAQSAYSPYGSSSYGGSSYGSAYGSSYGSGYAEPYAYSAYETGYSSPYSYGSSYGSGSSGINDFFNIAYGVAGLVNAFGGGGSGYDDYSSYGGGYGSAYDSYGGGYGYDDYYGGYDSYGGGYGYDDYSSYGSSYGGGYSTVSNYDTYDTYDTYDYSYGGGNSNSYFDDGGYGWYGGGNSNSYFDDGGYGW